LKHALRNIRDFSPRKDAGTLEKGGEAVLSGGPVRKRKESPGDHAVKAERREGLLESSLDEMKKDDIDAAANSKKSSLDVVRIVLLVICIGVFAYSSFKLLERFYYYYKGQKDYDSISDIFNDDTQNFAYLSQSSQSMISNTVLDALGGASAPIIEEIDVYNTDQQKLLDAKLEKLKKINSDIFGWIKIEGTKINYPVLRGVDNDHYLRYDAYNNFQQAGSIFMDYRNSKKLSSNLHTVLYGHNMRDGSMFAQLHNYDNEEMFRNGYVEVTTSEGTFVYKMFSVHRPHETLQYFRTEFKDIDDYYNFILELQSYSKFKTDIVLTPRDKVITLSTCVDAIVSSDYRFVIHAVLVDKK